MSHNRTINGVKMSKISNSFIVLDKFFGDILTHVGWQYLSCPDEYEYSRRVCRDCAVQIAMCTVSGPKKIHRIL